MQSDSRTLRLVVDRLLSMDGLPPEDKANVCLKVARVTKDPVDRDHYLSLVYDYLKLCDHAIAPLEVKFLVLSRADRDIDDVKDQLWQLVDEFNRLKYRLHAVTVVRSFIKYSRDTNPIRKALAITALAKCQQIAYQIGSRLHWTLAQQLYVPVMSGHNMRATTSFSETENLLNPRRMIPIPEIKFSLCLTMSFNYLQMGNKVMQLHWAALALDFARRTGERSKVSQATCNYLQAMAKLPSREDESPHFWSRLQASLLLAIEKDREAGLVQEEFNLLWFLLNSSGDKVASVLRRRASRQVDVVLNRAQHLADLLLDQRGSERCRAEIAL